MKFQSASSMVGSTFQFFVIARSGRFLHSLVFALLTWFLLTFRGHAVEERIFDELRRPSRKDSTSRVSNTVFQDDKWLNQTTRRSIYRREHTRKISLAHPRPSNVAASSRSKLTGLPSAISKKREDVLSAHPEYYMTASGLAVGNLKSTGLDTTAAPVAAATTTAAVAASTTLAAAEAATTTGVEAPAAQSPSTEEEDASSWSFLSLLICLLIIGLIVGGGVYAFQRRDVAAMAHMPTRLGNVHIGGEGADQAAIAKQTGERKFRRSILAAQTQSDSDSDGEKKKRNASQEDKGDTDTGGSGMERKSTRSRYRRER